MNFTKAEKYALSDLKKAGAVFFDGFAVMCHEDTCAMCIVYLMKNCEQWKFQGRNFSGSIHNMAVKHVDTVQYA